MKERRSFLKLPLLVAAILAGMLVFSVPASAATVCKIGSKGYSSLQKAVKAVKNGQTITVTQDIKTDDFLSLDHGSISYTINFNNKKYTYRYSSSKKEPALVLTAPTKVTLKKANFSSNCNSAGVSTGCIFNVSGSLIFESGTYTVPRIFNAKTMTIKGGTFKAASFVPDAYNGEKYLILNREGGTLTITGGTFKNNGKCGIITDPGGKKITIKGGTFTAARSTDGGLDMMKLFTAASITGGTFNCTDTGIWFSGNITISGGKFNFKMTKQPPQNSSAGGIAVGGEDNSPKLTIKGGTFTSTAASQEMNPACCVTTYTGTTTIIKGTFSGRQVINNGSNGQPNSVSKTIIKGGTFKGGISGNNRNGSVTISGGSGTQTILCRGGSIVVNKFTMKITDAREPKRTACFCAEGGTITVKGGSYSNPKGLAYQEAGGKVKFTVSNYKSLFKVRKMTE